MSLFPGTRAYNRIAHRKIVKIEARQRFPGGTVVKNLSANAGDARDTSLIPGLERSPGEGNGHPLQCSYPENSVDREAWQATVHGVRKSWTQLSTPARARVCTHTHTHTAEVHTRRERVWASSLMRRNAVRQLSHLLI